MHNVKESVVQIDLYDTLIVSVVGESSSEILDYLEDQWGYDEVDDDNFYGYTDTIHSTEHSLCIVLMFVQEKLTPGMIAHECYHAAEIITRHLSISDSEAFAYLLDYLVDTQHKQLKDLMKDE